MTAREFITDLGAFTIRVVTPLVILMLVVSSLWYSACRDTADTLLCGPYRNGRLEEISQTFLIVSCVLITFPGFCFFVTICLLAVIPEEEE